jgi:hypothetical protein
VRHHTAGAPPCPVCLRPDDGVVTCPGCGWRLIGDLVLGPVTMQAESDFAAELAAARRDFDVRAAVRAAGPPGEHNEALLRRLARRVRGGSDRADHDDHVRHALALADAPVPVIRAGIGFALTRLVAGKTRAIAFVEIGQDAITVRTLVAGQHGTPVQQVGDSLAWTDFMPVLPSDPDLRYLVMAGGVGLPQADLDDGDGQLGDDAGAGPGTLVSLVAEAVSPALTRLMQAADAAILASQGRDEPNSLPPETLNQIDVVLVRRTCRWPVLDAAYEHASVMLRPVAQVVCPADAGDLKEVVADLARQAPLRHSYDLVLARLDDDRVPPGAADIPVKIDPHELFAAGEAALPGQARSAQVTVKAESSYAGAILALPVVVRHESPVNFRRPDQLKDERPLLTMAAISGSAPEPVELRATLTGPGLVEFESGPRLLPASTAPSWPALMANVPRSLPTGLPLVLIDVVIFIELGGDDQTVAARVKLARGVLDGLRRETETVRVAVLGHRDHFGRHNVDAIEIPDEEHQALIVGQGLRPAAEARSVFDRIDRWRAVRVGDYHAAPIEDALQLVAGAGEEWGWSRTGRHVLLFIGGRPPHPARVAPEGGEILPCPHRRSWEESLSRLRTKQRIECLAVLDRQNPHGYAEYAWRQLSTEGYFYAGEVSPHQLARIVGPAPRAAGTELCLATHVGGPKIKDGAG